MDVVSVVTSAVGGVARIVLDIYVSGMRPQLPNVETSKSRQEKCGAHGFRGWRSRARSKRRSSKPKRAIGLAVLEEQMVRRGILHDPTLEPGRHQPHQATAGRWRNARRAKIPLRQNAAAIKLQKARFGRTRVVQDVVSTENSRS